MVIIYHYNYLYVSFHFFILNNLSKKIKKTGLPEGHLGPLAPGKMIFIIHVMIHFFENDFIIHVIHCELESIGMYAFNSNSLFKKAVIYEHLVVYL